MMQDTQKPAENFRDKIAWNLSRIVRFGLRFILSKRPLAYIITLESITSSLGMVGATLVHFRSIKMQKNGSNWIHTLVKEADNKRMHLLTLIKFIKLNWFERLFILTIQLASDILYAVLYFFSYKIAHRFIAYLEEEMAEGYTRCIEEVENGTIDKAPAPEFTKRHWNLSEEATLHDVLLAFREDEQKHAIINHQLSER